MKSLLILGARYNQLPAIRSAKARGLRVVVIDPDATAPGIEFADKAYSIDVAESDKCVDVAKHENIDGVLTIASEYALASAARIANVLNLPGLPESTVHNATNKRAMRERFAQAHVPAPQSVPVNSPSEILVARRRLHTDVIVKPVASYGGRGITKISTSDSDSHLVEAFSRAKCFSPDVGVLLEEFVGGREFSVEAITFGNVTQIVAVTDKSTSGEPFFVEIGHSQPTELSTSDLAKVEEVAIKAIQALDIDNSPSHTEVKLDDGIAKVIELGARLGGGFITSHLVPLSIGVDLVNAAIDLALGIEPNLDQRCRNGSAIQFVIGSPGVFERVHGVAEAMDIDGIVDVCIYLKEGDRIPHLKDSTGRIGHVIGQAGTAEEARRRVETAIKRVSLDVVSN